MCRERRALILLHLHILCVFITAGPITKLFSASVWIFGSLERIFRRTAVTHRARKVIQGGDCCPRRMSLLSFPGSFLSGILPSYGASTVGQCGVLRKMETPMVG